MINIIALILLSQLFFIFSQANGHVGLLEGSAGDGVHNTFLEKRQATDATSSGGETIMVNCFVSDKYPNVTGNVIDCFSAIDYLYSGTSRGAQGCAVCFSCAVMPFDGSLSPLGSGGQTPQMPQEEVNAGYDEWFKPGQVTAEVKRNCEPGYTTPPGLKLGKLPTPKTFYSTLLLGTRGGPCEACSEDLANDLLKNAN